MNTFDKALGKKKSHVHRCFSCKIVNINAEDYDDCPCGGKLDKVYCFEDIDVQKAKQKALKELSENRLDVESYEDSHSVIIRIDGEFVKWKDVEKCFGRME